MELKNIERKYKQTKEEKKKTTQKYHPGHQLTFLDHNPLYFV